LLDVGLGLDALRISELSKAKGVALESSGVASLHAIIFRRRLPMSTTLAPEIIAAPGEQRVDRASDRAEWAGP